MLIWGHGAVWGLSVGSPPPQLSTANLRLFEELLRKPHKLVPHSLVLQHLETRGYLQRSPPAPPEQEPIPMQIPNPQPYTPTLHPTAPIPMQTPIPHPQSYIPHPNPTSHIPIPYP